MSSDEEAPPTRAEKPVVIKNATDLQRLKLEKLMKNPERAAIIPEKPKERGMPIVPDFVRNVMGSSAGAGSGEFHVYRHLRRKEYARQKYMKEKGEREKIEQEYRDKIEANRRLAEEKTAKKRAKRLRKRKNLQRKLKRRKKEHGSADVKSEDESSSGGESVDDGARNGQTSDNSREEDDGENFKCDTAETESKTVPDEATQEVNSCENVQVALTE